MKYLRQMQVSRELFYFTNFPTIRKVTDKFKLFQKEYPFRKRRFYLHIVISVGDGLITHWLLLQLQSIPQVYKGKM